MVTLITMLEHSKYLVGINQLRYRAMCVRACVYMCMYVCQLMCAHVFIHQLSIHELYMDTWATCTVKITISMHRKHASMYCARFLQESEIFHKSRRNVLQGNFYWVSSHSSVNLFGWLNYHNFVSNFYDKNFHVNYFLHDLNWMKFI